jgi:hypothetical protein
MQSRMPRFFAPTPACLIGALLLPLVASAAEPASLPPPPAPSAAKPPPGGSNPSPTAPAPAPSAEIVLEAKQRFDRGFELYEEGEYPLALIEFNRAYQLVPNYKVLYNIGQVCIQLAQYANARRSLEEYLQKGGDALTADRQAAVKKDLEMLGNRTAFLTISANVDSAEVLVDDVSVGKTPLGPALLVDAGVHRVTLRRAGYLPKTSSVTLAGGDDQALGVNLELAPEEKQTIVVRERAADDSSKTWMIAGWVTTGALAAGAIVTGGYEVERADAVPGLGRAQRRGLDRRRPELVDHARSPGAGGRPPCGHAGAETRRNAGRIRRRPAPLARLVLRV